MTGDPWTQVGQNCNPNPTDPLDYWVQFWAKGGPSIPTEDGGFSQAPRGAFVRISVDGETLRVVDYQAPEIPIPALTREDYIKRAEQLIHGHLARPKEAGEF